MALSALKATNVSQWLTCNIINVIQNETRFVIILENTNRQKIRPCMSAQYVTCHFPFMGTQSSIGPMYIQGMPPQNSKGGGPIPDREGSSSAPSRFRLMVLL